MSNYNAEKSVLKVEAATGVYSVCPGVVSLDLPEITYEAVPTHTMGSGHMTTRPGSKADLGEASLEVIYDPANAVHTFLDENVGVEHPFDDGANFAIQDLFDDGDGYQYNVWIMSAKTLNKGRDNNQVHRSYKLKINGLPSAVAGS